MTMTKDELLDLIQQAKTFYHPDARIEWLVWQLAIALEKSIS